MKNMQPSSSGGFSDYHESSEQHITRRFEPKHYKPDTDGDQIMLDYLIDAGFAWEEAVTLLNLREHLYENTEMRQRMADDHRMLFVRWLYANGEMNEG